MNQNQLGIALLRIVATFSVIVIHVSAPILGKYDEISLFEWNIGNFYDSISRYSVPIFFMISGALLLNKDYSLKTFFKKRFMRIIPPFIFWSLVYSVFKRFIIGDDQFNFFLSLNKLIRDLFYGSEYHLWFIYVLIGLYLFTPIIRKWVKNSSSVEITFFLVIWILTLIYKIPKVSIYVPRIELTYFSGYLGFFVLGYYLSKKNFKNYIILILLFLIGNFITFYGTYFFTLKTGTMYNYFYEFLSLNILMVSTSLFLIFKSFSTKSRMINSLILKISQSCFGIYLVHVLILELFSMNGYDWNIFSPLISIPLISLSCFLCCFVIITLLKKNYLGKYISG